MDLPFPSTPLPSPPSSSAKEKAFLHDKVVPISQKKRTTDRMGVGVPLGSPSPRSPPTILKGWTFKHKGRLKGYPSIPVSAEGAHGALSCSERLTSENRSRLARISIAPYSVAHDPVKLRMMKLAPVGRKCIEPQQDEHAENTEDDLHLFSHSACSTVAHSGKV